MLIRFLNARLGTSDRGMALVTVIALGAVMTIMLTTMIAYGLGAYNKSAADVRWNSAFAAAYAGVEEYQSRLSNDTAYFRYGNPAAPFSASSDVELPPAANENPAFGLGTDGAWATIPGSGGDASFRYEVDASEYVATGTLRLRSTGRVGDTTRTIVADLRQQGFIDFVYFTDYEIQDPLQSNANIANCVRYAWAGRPSSGCSEIAFGSNDVTNGPAHSNDTIRICNSTWRGPVTTSFNPSSGVRYNPRDSNNNGCSGQIFELAGYPAYSPVIGMPQTNSQMRREVRSDLPVDVPRPGCLYTGPTSFVFNSNGTITVKSPWTRATRVAGQPATSGTAPVECGNLTALRSAAGATFTPPENNLLFVQNVPAVSTDPNFWATSSRPTGLRCEGESGSRVSGSLSSPGAGNGIGYPREDEQAPAGSAYGCRVGDAFMQGTMSGKLTIAAENYVYITGDIIYADSNEDILGVVGNNAIFVWNPVRSNGNTLLGNTGRRIDAALLSVERTFQVQNYTRGGDRGVLTVNGAIAQKFRGIVRSGTNGYAKNYQYDPRLRYTAPPKFLSPVSTTYGVNIWIESERAFNADGSVAG